MFWEMIVSVIVRKRSSYEHVSNCEWLPREREIERELFETLRCLNRVLRYTYVLRTNNMHTFYTNLIIQGVS